MKQFLKLVGLVVLVCLVVVLIAFLLCVVIALSPAITLCFIAYQVKEYFVYRKSAHCKLDERKALKKRTFIDLLQENENT